MSLSSGTKEEKFNQIITIYESVLIFKKIHVIVELKKFERTNTLYTLKFTIQEHSVSNLVNP